MATKTTVIELPNEIKKIDEKTPLQIGQNFDTIVAAIASMQTYLNEQGYSVIERTSDFEENAITYGADEPTD